MFSSTAEYALRAISYLAVQTEGLSTAQAIADATRVPQGYLSKIMKDLGDAGMVNAQRGPNGGFSLARSAETLTVLEVINAVDPLRRITMCPLGVPSHGTRLCKLHRRLDDAIALVERALADSTIEEIIERPSNDKNCAFPAKPDTDTVLTVRGKKHSRK